jgi:soluble lytic murein transglycosylase
MHRVDAFGGFLGRVGILLVLFLLAACGGSDGNEPLLITTPVVTRPMPTPTLAPGVATAMPDPIGGRATPVPGNEAGSGAESATLLPSLTPTASPSPTPDLSAAERLALGHAAYAIENFPAAINHYALALERPGGLSLTGRLAALYRLGQAQFYDGNFAGAADKLNQFLATTTGAAPEEPLGREAAAAYFYLAEAYAGLGDGSAAIGAYRSYLDAFPEMEAYVQPLIARQHLNGGDDAAAVAAYEAALAAGAQRLKQIDNRRELADLYLRQEQYAAAQAQYDAIHELVVTENTRGEMSFLAGQAAILAGDTETGYARYLRAVNEYPRAYDAYLSLVELVAAGVPVDDYQRGLVDFYAEVYEPAVNAFNQYLADNPAGYRPDAHLYLAWSYEKLGNLEAALAELAAYATAGATPEADQPQAARALLERADMLARNGLAAEAQAEYAAYAAAYPGREDAPYAATQAAEMIHQQGDPAGAVTALQAVAETFPAAEETPPALFRAGWLAYQAGDLETAVAAWTTLTDQYPDTPAGAAGYVWLLRNTPAAEAEPLAAEVLTRTLSTGYYPLRARELAAGGEPFTPPEETQFAFDEAAGRAETESWLAEWVPPGSLVTHTLSTTLATDSRLARGESLWQVGLREAARQEFESLRADYAANPLLQYQLALYLRDLGLYRTSIAAASALLSRSGNTIWEAPPFIGRLLYPVYYADLIVPLAEQYGYDPLLQFALVRQESLYESFVSSFAGAQGLSQVMPATGADIASRLNWPDYENADLYRPHVSLAFGAYYIATQLDFFEDTPHVALAAYNAGPGNAAAWFEAAGSDLDLFVETVNFPETRLYIERIYEGYQYYAYLYGN